ncbi:MAG: hypothetical protein KA354_21175 [Phycisphaerae bacterium]|nr:hypothetical protein [Phycisphaerae bacterium]
MDTRQSQPGRRLGPPTRVLHRYLAFGLLVTVILGGTFAMKHARRHGRPGRFAEVEPGQLYRSARPDAESLRQVVREYKLNAVLALEADERGHPRRQEEEQVLRGEGVQLVRIPIPGEGEKWTLALDKAAQVLADPASRPLLVYCVSGVEHTGAVFMAYRLRYGRWSFQQALAEGDRHGCGIQDRPELVRDLRKYYQEHVLAVWPAASASAPADSGSDGR